MNDQAKKFIRAVNASAGAGEAGTSAPPKDLFDVAVTVGIGLGMAWLAETFGTPPK